MEPLPPERKPRINHSMSELTETMTAADVIRCVYLARLALKRGDHATARRWQAKADAWLERWKSTTEPRPVL